MSAPNERSALQSSSSRRRLASCLLLFLLSVFGNGAQNPLSSPRTARTKPPPSKSVTAMSTSFDDVHYGFLMSPCSPRFTKEEPDGIKIAAPEVFSLSARDKDGDRAMLPLCMTLRFSALYLERFEQPFRAVKVVAVDDEHGKTLSAGVWRERHYIPNPPSNIPPEELKVRISTECCTVNLLEFMRFPKRKATYKVYALLEEYKSNVVTIQIAP
jgi:hypothetical protein